MDIPLIYKILTVVLLVGFGQQLHEAKGAVTDTTDHTFTASWTLRINAAPADVYAGFIHKVSNWWNPAHTFSGDAANLNIDAIAGGCFCERLPDGGSAVHGMILMAAPGNHLRFRGSLGPLQPLPVTGVLDVAMEADSTSTRLSIHYRVGGFAGPSATSNWAEQVDRVLEEQWQRLKSYIETGEPE